jgi:hypothetical protein
MLAAARRVVLSSTTAPLARQSSVTVVGASGVCARFRLLSSLSDQGADNKLYLHIAPSGDFWCGTKIYAAKHLSSNYLKSLELPKDFKEEELEDLPLAAFLGMYDNGQLVDQLRR